MEGQFKIECKAFPKLNLEELYFLLQLRNKVFVIEQNCNFLDTDGVDLKAFHLSILYLNSIVAYARLIPAGIVFSEISIGRVVTDASYRRTGIGKILMQEAIKLCYELFGKQAIRIGAQYYLVKFYSSFGFIPDGAIYLEDGIEHIEMVLH